MSNDKVNRTLDRNVTQDQFPLKVAGNGGQDAFVGQHKVSFCGTTGLPTSIGFPGVTIGRLQTGIYGIRFPRWKEVGMTVGLMTPTGIDYTTSTGGLSGVAQIVGLSGGAELRLGNPASGTRVNPVTGTVANLMFFVNPVTQY
jgi:hypothetical protein